MASLPSSQVYIVRDDENGEGLNLQPQQWALDVEDFYFGPAKRVIWPGFAVNASSPRGSFSYDFNGTELRLFGVTADVDATQVFQVTIDNNAPYNTSTDDTSPQHYRQWYQSPPLADGSHHIQFDLLDGQALDYIVVAPGPDSPLNGTTLMIDDTYNGIKYSDGWQTIQNSTYIQSSIVPGNSFMNTSHQTSTAGESFTFSYTGSNLSVYGNFLWEQVGALTLSYNIDGGANFTQTYQSNGSNPIKEEPNFKLADTGSITAGNHTLTLTLTDCVSQTLVIDYMLYTPSFDTLASMPNLTAASNSTGAQTSPNSSSGSTSHIGAIIGGVVGGVAFIVILAALVFFWLRRQKRSKIVISDDELEPETPAANYMIEPYSVAAPSSAGLASPTRPPTMNTKHGATRGSMVDLSYSITSPTTPATPSAEGSSLRARSPPLRLVTSPSVAESTTSHVDELRRQIHELTEENQNLIAMHAPPPAYTDD